VLIQVDPEQLLATCGADPSLICRETLDRTGNESLAEALDVLLGTPLMIAVVLGVAWLIRRLLYRAIDRVVASMTGRQAPSRRLRRRLRRTPVADKLPAGLLATGELSIRSAARAETLGLVLRSITGAVVWSIAVVTILGELGVNLGPLIASAGIAGVAIGFGAQSLVKDFVSGIFILVEDQYGVGDVVDVGELSGTQVSGTIEAVSLRATRVRSVNGTVWHVPNGTILRVGNMSQQWARALLDVSVAYGSDLDLAQAVIKRAADEVWHDPDWAGQVLEEPEVWGVEDLAPGGVVIRLVVKTQPAEQFRVLRELRARITAALADAGVDVPAAPRTVWIQREPGAPALPADDPDGEPDRG
jgi:small conductance mechanosensitive channel